MKTADLKVALAGGLALLLSACSQVLTPTLTYNTMSAPTKVGRIVEAQSSPGLSTNEADEIHKQMAQTTQPSFSSTLEALIGEAKQDLARRLGISVDDITVVTVLSQEFSSDAFYCRTAKERIAKEDSPLVVSGQSILLGTPGRRYEYHADEQTVIFCRPVP